MLCRQFYLIMLLLCSACATQSHAQRAQYFEQNFAQALAYMDELLWAEALRIWADMRQSDPRNPYEIEAYYFSALCLFHLKQYDEAEALLLNILNRHQPWQRQDEVFYLLANIAFEKQEDHLALQYIQRIRQLELHNQANAMKGAYLQQRPVRILRNLHELFPNDLFLAQILVNRIAAQPRTSEDIALIRQLVARYNLQAPQLPLISKQNQSDTLYAVLFYDFRLQQMKRIDTLAYKQSLRDTPGAAAFLGAKAAETVVDSLGRRWRVVAYDWARVKDSIDAWLSDGELAYADLMIASPEVSAFKQQLAIAEKLGIPLVQLYEVNYEMPASPFLLCMRPQMIHVQESVVDFVRRQPNVHRLLCLYTDEYATQAELFQKSAQQLALNCRLQPISMSQLGRLAELLKQELLNADFVYCLSSSQLVAQQLLQYWADNHVSTVLLAPDIWRTYPGSDAKLLSQMPVYFVAPNYQPSYTQQDQLLAKYNWWMYRIAYRANYRRIPTEAYLAYDLLLILGRTYRNTYNWTELPERPLGITLRPYRFVRQKSHTIINTMVPIVRYEEEKVQLVNDYHN